MDNKITRLLYVLNCLDRGEVNLKKLADEMGVALRTVQRYIATIQDAEFPIYDIRPGVYTFVDGFNLSKMQISAQEAGVLAFLSDIANTLGDNFADAYKGLCRRITAPNQDNPFFLKIAKGLNFEDTPLTQTLRQAIRKKKYLLVNYKSQTGQKEKQHLVIPVKIAWYEGFWYLVCIGKDERIFKFRLDRILKAEQQKKSFNIDDKKFTQLLNQSVNIFFEGERNILVTLQVSGKVAHYFKQREYFPEQKIIKENKNGDLTLTSKISKPEEILMIIFHWLPHIKVIDPKEIKTAVKNTIKEYLKTI
ncbi:MAG: transcriptional regulator [Elusimicrobiaceae bacterium]|nr:transcriptional regulator [Elusimicrobiaceae bacterium]